MRIWTKFQLFKTSRFQQDPLWNWFYFYLKHLFFTKQFNKKTFFLRTEIIFPRTLIKFGFTLFFLGAVWRGKWTKSIRKAKKSSQTFSHYWEKLEKFVKCYLRYKTIFCKKVALDVLLMNFSYLKKKCFVLEIFRFLCFCKIQGFQNMWSHYRHCYKMVVTLMLVYF